MNTELFIAEGNLRLPLDLFTCISCYESDTCSLHFLWLLNTGHESQTSWF